MGLMWVKSMGQSCSWEHVGQIYEAGAAVLLMWVRSIGQELLWVISIGHQLLHI